MIVCQVYPNDNNKILKQVQHEHYLKLVGFLFDYVKNRFLKAANLLLHNSASIEKLKEWDSFDHRVLQEAHDIIAAKYRYQYDDGGQIDFLVSIPQEDIYRKGWISWFHQEAQLLIDNDEFCRAIINVVIFQNNELGYSAEAQLKEFLYYHYSIEEWFN